MRRFLTLPIAILTVVLLIVGCTSSDDTAEEPTTAAPAVTVAAPVTTTTTTTEAATTTTLEPLVVDETDLHGVWITERERKYLTFNEDGSWTGQADLELEVFRDAGTFTFDGEVLMVRSDPAFACAYAEEGSYGVDFTDVNTIRLTVIDDPCTPRAGDLTSGLVRYSPTTTAGTVEEPMVCGQTIGGGFSEVQCEDMVFDMALPETCLEGSCGLIVDVHGYSASGKDAESHTGMQGLGNAARYVVVQPNSPGITWDFPIDSGRIRSFLDQLIPALDIDTNRVHIGGHSDGGYMTWMFICDHADLVASAAPLGAGASTESGMSCDFDVAGSPSEEVDILLAHGRNDDIVPFDTALAQRDLVVTSWAMSESEILADEPSYRWTRWTSPEGTVFEFLEFDWQGGMLGNHCYPGVTGGVGCGSETPVHYGEAALEFYIAHPKDE